MKRPPASLEARAMAWLAQREQSREEMRRKLLRAAHAEVDCAGNDDAARPDPLERVEHLLDRLQAGGLLNEQRFVESRIRTREARSGLRRIEHELSLHGLRMDAALRQSLQTSELQRAQALWHRRFDGPAHDPRERARQIRFLSARGFASEVIRQVVRGEGGAPADPPD
jgi:regulatory protein